MGAAASSAKDTTKNLNSTRPLSRAKSNLSRRRNQSNQIFTASPTADTTQCPGSIAQPNSSSAQQSSQVNNIRPHSQENHQSRHPGIGYTRDVEQLTRDLTLSRILSADEFLGNMLTTDKDIFYWTRQRHDNAAHDRTADLLGLRGHLQDELLRIQEMLSEWDPELKALDHFNDSYPEIVHHLKDLNKKAKVINHMSETTDIASTMNPEGGPNEQEQIADTMSLALQMDPALIHAIDAQLNLDEKYIDTTKTNTTSPCIGVEVAQDTTLCANCSHASGFGTAISCQCTKNKTTEISCQTIDHIPSENVLKKKHLWEEDCLATEFANKMTQSSIDQNEVNNLLTQHAVSMQALRKRQELERKKRERDVEQRLHERAVNNEHTTTSDKVIFPVDTSVEIIENQQSSKQSVKDGNDDAKELQDLLSALSTNNEIRDSDDEFDNADLPENNVAVLADEIWGNRANITSEDLDEILEKFRNQHDQLPMNSSKFDEEAVDDLNDTEITRKELDDLFASRFARAAEVNMSDSECQDMISEYLTSLQEIKNKRRREQGKWDCKLEERLRRKNGIAEETAEEDMESFRKTLTAQFKCQYDERSEDNFASLMKNYHDSKDKIKTRRQLEKDLMNERLEERLHQRNSTKSEPNETHTISHEQLFDDLKKSHSDMNGDEFAQMLTNYLKTMNWQQEHVQKRSKDKDSHSVTANDVLQDHQQNSKQIQQMRHREKQIMDERLQAKLKKKIFQQNVL